MAVFLYKAVFSVFILNRFRVVLWVQDDGFWIEADLGLNAHLFPWTRPHGYNCSASGCLPRVACPAPSIRPETAVVSPLLLDRGSFPCSHTSSASCSIGSAQALVGGKALQCWAAPPESRPERSPSRVSRCFCLVVHGRLKCNKFGTPSLFKPAYPVISPVSVVAVAVAQARTLELSSTSPFSHICKSPWESSRLGFAIGTSNLTFPIPWGLLVWPKPRLSTGTSWILIQVYFPAVYCLTQ